ncbi:hypothetical protein ABZV29_31390, partial [Streptomyces sp. NPDC005236]|uniref:hypothetical protein n=1 Tax=Streptomyces sp. NPDC005236 TaxID=3157028 RepID=UPI0033B9C10B
LYFEGRATEIYTFQDQQDPLSGVSTPRGSPQNLVGNSHGDRFLRDCADSTYRVPTPKRPHLARELDGAGAATTTGGERGPKGDHFTAAFTM